MAHPEPEHDLTYWLLLAKLELSPNLVRELLSCFGSARGIFEASRTELMSFRRGAERLYNRVREVESTTDIAEMMRLLRTVSAEPISLSDVRYPARLKEIHAPPPVLFVRGDSACIDAACVALVGSRRSSPYGVRVAEQLSADLARSGLTVVSGLAVGIDSAGHRGALAGGGRTAAVLGCGIDVDYPRASRGLRDEIIASGAVLTEFCPGTQPRQWSFPQRNRIVSGLCLGTIVVEAPEKSGALITADLALEQGREVMAVPGDVYSGTSRGCHRLLRDGATLVETAEDVLEALGLQDWSSPPPAPETGDLSPPEDKVLRALRPEGVLVDHLAEATGLRAAEVASCLMLLEMKGRAQRLPGGRYARR